MYSNTPTLLHPRDAGDGAADSAAMPTSDAEATPLPSRINVLALHAPGDNLASFSLLAPEPRARRVSRAAAAPSRGCVRAGRRPPRAAARGGVRALAATLQRTRCRTC